jgi:hypothetical protein
MGTTPDGMAGKYPVKTGGPEDIQTAWKILAGGAPVAAAALVDIAENGKSELARVQASTAVLDRVGLATPKERPSVTFAVIPKEAQEYGITQQISPAEVIRSRLKELGQLAEHSAAMSGAGPQPGTVPEFDYASSAGTDDDSEPIDAELVEDDDGDWGSSNPWA